MLAPMLAPMLAMALTAARVAVMPMTPGPTVGPAEAAVLTEALVSEVRRRSGAEVITQAEIVTMLTLDQQRRMLGCTSDQCMAELGGALGAGRLVTGNVARLGESLLVHLRLMDSGKVRVVAQSDRRLKRGSYDDLLDVLPVMVSELFAGQPGADRPPPPVAAAPRERPARSGASLAPPAPRAADFQLPEGMFAIHVARPEDLGLVAWSAEPSSDGSKVYPRYVTSWVDFMKPTGSTDFGLYWLLPAAEFKTGKASFGFVVPSRFHFGESIQLNMGKGCCGAMSWSLGDSRQVWIDARQCRGYRTVGEAVRASR